MQLSTRLHRFVIFSIFSVFGFLPNAAIGETSITKPIQVVVSLEPLAYFAERVGGDDVHIEVMMPSGACIESYEPQLKQVRISNQADVFIKIGHPAYMFETNWLDTLMASNPKLRVINLYEGMDIKNEDPHIWLSIPTAQNLVQQLLLILSELNPARSNYYASRAAQTSKEILELDIELKNIFKEDRNRPFFVFHPAFSYFAKQFGLRQISVEQEGREPSVGDLMKVIREAKQAGIKVLLVPPNALEDNAKIVAEEFGGKTEVLDPLKRDWFANMKDSAQKIKAGLGKPMNYAIEVRNLSLSLGERLILEDVELLVSQGDFVGLIGPNGAGKTVLLKLVMGMIQPTSGSVTLFGHAPVIARSRVGYVPQFASFDRNFPISARDVVLMSILGARGALARPHSRDIERAMFMLAQVSLSHVADRQIGRLSGGELQRVLIARALANDPDLVILDEPTASLDSKVGTDLYALLANLAEKKTILMVSHDIGVISSYVKTIACLNRTLHCHPHSEITGAILSQTYACPVELIAHGLPHRVLANHDLCCDNAKSELVDKTNVIKNSSLHDR